MKQAQIDSIARLYQRGVHDPSHPAYARFVEETINQYREMRIAGVKPVFTSGTLTGSSDEMFTRLDGRRELVIAVDGAGFAPEHPLTRWIPEWNITVNTVFRTVHDFFGHYATRTPFETFAGELEAYRNHERLYSAAARPALFCETVMQLCVFYSTGGFVDVQKCVVLD